MTQRCFLPVAVVALLMTTAAMETSAQPSPAGSLPRVDDALVGVPGFYFITRPGDALIQVTAVGIVANQGRYAVSAGTPLADLLAYAGGAAVDRTGTARVRLYRDGSQLFERDVRDLYSEDATPVPLREGDVIEVVGLTSTVPGFYIHSQPGSEPFEVTAAGAFASPGLYTIDPGTTLGDLVALAGGVGNGVRQANTEVTSTVRLFRNAELVYESPLEDLYARQTQLLEQGDVVDLRVVVRQRGSFFRDALSIVTAGLSVAILVERLTRG